jgi:ketosteroid isomerase-like protein
MDFRQLVQQYHAAADHFARGDPEPVKRIFSHRDDVTLANPFGPAVHGWENVSKALEFASARFRDGKVTRFETVAEYVAPDLATILEVERWQAKVSGRNEQASFELRVTSTFRREDATWKIVHRHADPIATAHPDGPLRPTGA